MNETSSAETPPSSAPAPARTTTLREAVGAVTLAPVRSVLIDASGLSPGLRTATLGSYVVFVLIIASALLLPIVDGTLLRFAYPAPQAVTRELTWVAVAVISIGYASGWALLLTGAAGRHPALLALASLLFGLNSLFVRPEQLPTALAQLPVVLALVAVIGLGLGLAARAGLVERAPHLTVLLTALVIAGAAAGFWLSGDPAARGAQSQAAFAVLFFLSIPIWCLAGLALAQFGIGLGRACVMRLRQTTSERGIRRIAAWAVFGHPLLLIALGCPAIALILTDQAEAVYLILLMIIDLFFCSALALVGLVLLALRRWTTRTAALLLAVRVALLLEMLAFIVLQGSGFNITDPVTGAVEQLNLFPPAFFFMATLVLSVLGFFAPFANRNSARLPRSIRVPLALGAAVLIVTAMFFFLNARDVSTGEDLVSGSLLPSLFYVSADAIGLPYLVYLTVRRRDEIVGPQESWEPEANPTPAAQLGGRALLMLIGLLPLVTLLLGCALVAMVTIRAAS
jgi:hypothetical protein